MKSKEIAKNYGIDNGAFDSWLKQSAYSHKSAMIGGLEVADGQDIEEIVKSFKEHHEREREGIARRAADRERAAKEEKEAEHRAAAEKRAAERDAAQEKQAAMAGMLITSGFNFDGFSITKYSGYISGDDAVQVDRGTDGFFSQATDVGSSLMASLAGIRRNALTELKESAYALGCNAVIGVDFDYLTLDPETANSGGGTTYMPYVFGVTANGNAVIIERNSSPGLS